MRRDDGFGAAVLAAFILVCVVVIFMAAAKSCNEEPPEDTVDTPVGTMPVATTTHEPEEREWEAEFRAQVSAQVDVQPERTYIGLCRLTVYNAEESHHGYNTATGAKSRHMMTCAVDPGVIPYGSVVIVVDRDGEEHRFKAVDCGDFRGKWVDIFFDGTERHGIEWLDECFGGDFGEVWIEEPYCPTIEMLP